MARILILFVAVSLLPRGLAAQQTPPDVSVLTFDWPVGLTARVTHAREQIFNAAMASEGELYDTSGAVLVSSMRVREHPDGLLVSYDDLAVELLPGSNHFAEMLLLGQALAPMADLVVADEGIPVDVVGLGDITSRVRSVLEPVFASLPQPRPGSWEWEDLDATRLQELATGGALAPWGYLVSAWVDGELERGVVQRMEIEDELLMYPGVVAPFVYEFTYSSREPCTPSASEDSCVVLEITSVPESRRFAAIMDSLATTKAQDIGFPYRGKIVSLQVKNHVRLVTEAVGLIPHRLDIVKWFAMEMAIGEERGKNEVTTRDAYTFEYASR